MCCSSILRRWCSHRHRRPVGRRQDRWDQIRRTTPNRRETQALALMNEVAFVEASRGAAQSLLNSGLTTAQRIDRIFRQATGRHPTDAEAVLLAASLKKYRDAFAGNAHSARQLVSIGESSIKQQTDVEELAAWTTLVSLIMNLDEVITKD